MSIDLALADAARNCTYENATSTVTLRSGVQLTGKLRRNQTSMDTYSLRLPGGGWCVFRTEEVAAVESTR